MDRNELEQMLATIDARLAAGEISPEDHAMLKGRLDAQLASMQPPAAVGQPASFEEDDEGMEFHGSGEEAEADGEEDTSGAYEEEEDDFAGAPSVERLPTAEAHGAPSAAAPLTMPGASHPSPTVSPGASVGDEHECSSCTRKLPVIRAYKPRKVICPYCSDETEVKLYYEMLRGVDDVKVDAGGSGASSAPVQPKKQRSSTRTKRDLTQLTSDENPKPVSVKTTFPIIYGKTLSSLATPLKTTLLLFFLVFMPMILGASGADLAKAPVDYQMLATADFYLAFAFLWTAGLPLAIVAAATAATFVADESADGTLLTLISRPVERWEILMAKYAAAVTYLFGVVTVALVLGMYLISNLAMLHSSVFDHLLTFLPGLMIYSMLIILLFTALPGALSCIVDKSSKATVVMIGLSTLIFVGFILFRLFAGQMYDMYYLYHADPGYHLGNVYVAILEGTGYTPSPVFQEYITILTGTYDITQVEQLYQANQGFSLPTLPKTLYYETYQSLLYWLLIGFGSLAGGLKYLQTREVN